MNNKFRFIRDEKTIVDVIKIIKVEDGKFALEIANRINPNDGHLFCTNCNYNTDKDKFPGTIVIINNAKKEACPNCGAILTWDLQKQFDNQVEIDKSFADLMDLTNLLHNTDLENKICNAVNLLTAEQIRYLFPSFVISLFSKMTVLSNRNDKQNEQIKLLETKIVSLESDQIKINTRLNLLEAEQTQIRTTISAQQLQQILEKFDQMKSFVDTFDQLKIKLENQEMSVADQQNQKLSVMTQEQDMWTIKNTLNIMIELFEKGMDLNGILLKARVQPNKFSPSYDVYPAIVNSNLQYDNLGNYIGTQNDILKKI
jgi:hypothetical protein